MENDGSRVSPGFAMEENFSWKKAWAFFVPVYGISDPVRPAIEVQAFIGAGRFSGVGRPGERVARSRKKFAMGRFVGTHGPN